MLLFFACASPAPDNSAPELSLTAPTAGSSWVGRVAVSGQLSEAATVRITTDAGLDLAEAAVPAGAFATTVAAPVGSSVLVLTATDPAGNEVAASVLVHVAEYGLTAPAVGIEPAAPVTGDVLDAVVHTEGVSESGAAVSTTYAWTDAAGTLYGDNAVGPVSEGEQWTLTVTATDGTFSTTIAQTVTVGNAPPSVTDLTLTQSGGTLDCTWTEPTDPEGDAVTITPSIFVDGVRYEGVATFAGARRGQVAWCTLFLGGGAAQEQSSAPMVVQNSLPSATVTLVPSAPTRATGVTCHVADVVDADGDVVAVSTTWTVNGVETDGVQLSGEDLTRGDTATCTAALDDGAAGRDTRTASVLIGNTAPTVTDVHLDPTVAAPGSPVRCVMDATDLDGDPLTSRFEWTLDGAFVSDSETIDTTGFFVGAVLLCAAEADDTLDVTTATARMTLAGPIAGDHAAVDADLTLVGSYDGDAFGKAVDAVDDLDGDGRSELLVSASGSGYAFLFTSSSLPAGGTVGAGAAAMSWIPSAVDSGFGGARGVAGLGDLDADGLGDLALAAPQSDLGGEASGAVYVVFGADAGGVVIPADEAAGATIDAQPGDWLGVRMDGGDLDGDGVAELALGAPYNDLGGSKAGAVFVWPGADVSGAMSVDDAVWTLTGAAAGDELGWSLDIGPDADGDGYDELLVGAFYADPGGVSGAGTGYALSNVPVGVHNAADAAFFALHGTADDDRMGYDAQALGDVDGDGLGELFFGAYLSDTAGADAGEGRLIFGAAALSGERAADEADATFFGSAGAQFATVVQALGDIDADGAADLLIGAPVEDGVGAASLFRGNTLGGWGADGLVPSARFVGTGADDRFGDELAGELDLDGDGNDDIVIGAQASDAGATGGGAVYVWWGP